MASWDAVIAERAENNKLKQAEIEKGRIAFKEALADSMAEEERKKAEAKHKSVVIQTDMYALFTPGLPYSTLSTLRHTFIASIIVDITFSLLLPTPFSLTCPTFQNRMLRIGLAQSSCLYQRVGGEAAERKR